MTVLSHRHIPAPTPKPRITGMVIAGALAIILAFAIVSLFKPPAARADTIPNRTKPAANLFTEAPAARTSWTGCYINAQTGMAAAHHEVAGVISLSAQGALGALGGGCDLHVAGTPFVIGALTDYAFRNVGAGIVGANITLEGAWTVGGRAGVLAGDKLLIYGLGAWTQTSASSTLALPSTFDGYVAGAGVEAMLNQAFSLGLEYRGIYYDSEAIPGAGPFAVSPYEHQLRLKAAWRFGMPK